jgi:hypothetical protein
MTTAAFATQERRGKECRDPASDTVSPELRIEG